MIPPSLVMTTVAAADTADLPFHTEFHGITIATLLTAAAAAVWIRNPPQALGSGWWGGPRRAGLAELPLSQFPVPVSSNPQECSISTMISAALGCNSLEYVCPR